MKGAVAAARVRVRLSLRVCAGEPVAQRVCVCVVASIDGWVRKRCHWMSCTLQARLG